MVGRFNARKMAQTSMVDREDEREDMDRCLSTMGNSNPKDGQSIDGR